MGFTGSGLRVPRGPVGFLAGLIGGLEPSMPAIREVQKRRREENAKKDPKPPAPSTSGTTGTSGGQSTVPKVEESDPEHGGSAAPDARLPGWDDVPPGYVPEPPGPSDRDLEYEEQLSGKRAFAGPGTTRLAAYPRGDGRRLTRMLYGGRPAGTVRGAAPVLAGYAPGGRGGARSTAAGRSDAGRYANHLRRAGMPEALVQQLTAAQYPV